MHLNLFVKRTALEIAKYRLEEAKLDHLEAQLQEAHAKSTLVYKEARVKLTQAFINREERKIE